MDSISTMTAPVLERFLLQARLTGAQASLRLEGPRGRIFGDLHIQMMRPGTSISLTGLHLRDSVPPPGMPVTLTILLGEEVLTLQSTVQSATPEAEGPILHLEWPQEPAQAHARREVRMAGPSQSPLKARVNVGNQLLDALLVNLTETGVGLAFREALTVDLHATVQIDADLPDGAGLHCPGEVRHLTFLEGQAYPTRLGIVLQPPPGTDLGPMHRFIQARRTDRSQSLRRG